MTNTLDSYRKNLLQSERKYLLRKKRGRPRLEAPHEKDVERILSQLEIEIEPDYPLEYNAGFAENATEVEIKQKDPNDHDLHTIGTFTAEALNYEPPVKLRKIAPKPSVHVIKPLQKELQDIEKITCQPETSPISVCSTARPKSTCSNLQVPSIKPQFDVAMVKSNPVSKLKSSKRTIRTLIQKPDTATIQPTKSSSTVPILVVPSGNPLFTAPSTNTKVTSSVRPYTALIDAAPRIIVSPVSQNAPIVSSGTPLFTVASTNNIVTPSIRPYTALIDAVPRIIMPSLSQKALIKSSENSLVTAPSTTANFTPPGGPFTTLMGPGTRIMVSSVSQKAFVPSGTPVITVPSTNTKVTSSVGPFATSMNGVPRLIMSSVSQQTSIASPVTPQIRPTLKQAPAVSTKPQLVMHMNKSSRKPNTMRIIHVPAGVELKNSMFQLQTQSKNSPATQVTQKLVPVSSTASFPLTRSRVESNIKSASASTPSATNKQPSFDGHKNLITYTQKKPRDSGLDSTPCVQIKIEPDEEDFEQIAINSQESQSKQCPTSYKSSNKGSFILPDDSDLAPLPIRESEREHDKASRILSLIRRANEASDTSDLAPLPIRQSKNQHENVSPKSSSIRSSNEDPFTLAEGYDLIRLTRKQRKMQRDTASPKSSPISLLNKTSNLKRNDLNIHKEKAKPQEQIGILRSSASNQNTAAQNSSASSNISTKVKTVSCFKENDMSDAEKAKEFFLKAKQAMADQNNLLMDFRKMLARVRFTIDVLKFGVGAVLIKKGTLPDRGQLIALRLADVCRLH